MSLEHDGREKGVRTQVFIDPDKQEGLVILTNSSNGELVVRPLAKAIMTESNVILQQRDSDTWHYLQSLPAPMHFGMVNFISQSPSFTQKLLHAAYVGIIENSSLNDQDKAEIHEMIDNLVLAMHKKKISTDNVLAVLLLLGQGEGQEFRLLQQFDDKSAKNFLDKLIGLLP